jgi:hypothetical protein
MGRFELFVEPSGNVRYVRIAVIRRIISNDRNPPN